MTFTQETWRFLAWLQSATRQLLRVDRRTTSGLVVAIIAHQITTMLAFFLPLKVILLVGSPGVPRYFRFFVADETRDTWVVILAIATFVFFVLSQYLESVIERRAARGGDSLRRSTDQVPIAGDEAAVTEATYHSIADSSAKLGFAATVVLAGLALFPPLFATIVVLLAVELWAVSRAAGNLDAAPRNWLGRRVREEPTQLLKLVKAANFLVVFAFLLAMFLGFGGVNLLIAIASIMMSRQLFGSVGDVVKNALKLTKGRTRVDALIFPAAQLLDEDRRGDREFRERFEHAARLERIAWLAATAEEGDGPHPEAAQLLDHVADSVWVDPGTSRAATFDLYGPGESDTRRRLLREHVHSTKGAKGLEQHDYLLGQVDASVLRCPPRVATYEDNGFMGRIVDIRGLQPPDSRTWKAGRPELLVHLWDLEPPAGLIRSFLSARPLLADRLAATLVERLAVAAAEPWARAAHARIAAELDALGRRVAALPLSLFNHRLSRRNALADPDGRLRLVSWTSWGLEPVGAGFLPESDDVQLLYCAASAAARRYEPRTAVPLAEVLCAATLYRMEQLVSQRAPKSALRLASDMLPLLDLDDGALLEALDSPERQQSRDQFADAADETDDGDENDEEAASHEATQRLEAR